jgi:alkylated DNA repair dioxygenase AlkB
MPHRLQIPLKQGTVWYEENYLDAEFCTELWNELETQLPWKQEPIIIFGKEVMQPRLTCWCGKPEAIIRYSGINMMPVPYSPLLKELNEKLSNYLEKNFNGVLLNYYRDGNDSMGWHSDDEAYQGKNPTIASISLGAQRTFQLKPKQETGEGTYRLPLSNGSLLVMSGETQTHYKHQVPKTKMPLGPRINLTFRTILY